MNLRKINTNFRFPVYLLLFILLVIVFFHLYDIFYEFRIDREINLVDILSIIITIGLAYYISTKIEKDKEDHRVIKALITQQYQILYNSIEDFQKIILESNPHFIKVTSINKEIFFQLNNITILKKELNSSTSVNASNLFILIKQLKSFTTNSSLRKGDKHVAYISIKDDIVTVIPEMKTPLDYKFMNLKSEVLKEMIQFNKI